MPFATCSIALACSIALTAAATACERRSTPAGNEAVSPLVTPPGFHRVGAAGWSLATPSAFAPLAPRADTGDMTWLVHVGDPKAPGSPTLLLARHTRPAEFPSQVFGHSVVEQVKREPSKRLVASHQVDTNIGPVTDLELELLDARQPRRQWRRVFVHEQMAYVLSFTVGAAEAKRARATATAIFASLGRQ